MRFGFLLGAAAALAVGLGSGVVSAAELPPASDKQVDFKADIWPIFQARCVECHGPEKKKSGLRMHTKEEAMKGGTEGPMVVAGKSAESLLVQLIAGTNENFDKMPPEGDPLTDEQIGLVRAWIDQGANWPDDFATPPLDAAPAPAPAPESTPAPAPGSTEAPAADAAPATTAGAEGMPAQWKVEATKQEGPLSSWGVVKDATGPAGDPVFGVLAANHTGANTHNLLWMDALKLMNGSIKVLLKPVSGTLESGGGLIWRVKDKDNYYAARYNALKGNVKVFKVEGGERHELGTTDYKSDKEWVSILIEAHGDHIKVTVDDTASIEADDATFNTTGGAGFWTEADAVTHFAGTEISIDAQEAQS